MGVSFIRVENRQHVNISIKLQDVVKHYLRTAGSDDSLNHFNLKRNLKLFDRFFFSTACLNIRTLACLLLGCSPGLCYCRTLNSPVGSRKSYQTRLSVHLTFDPMADCRRDTCVSRPPPGRGLYPLKFQFMHGSGARRGGGD